MCFQVFVTLKAKAIAYNDHQVIQRESLIFYGSKALVIVLQIMQITQIIV